MCWQRTSLDGLNSLFSFPIFLMFLQYVPWVLMLGIQMSVLHYNFTALEKCISYLSMISLVVTVPGLPATVKCSKTIQQWLKPTRYRLINSTSKPCKSVWLFYMKWDQTGIVDSAKICNVCLLYTDYYLTANCKKNSATVLACNLRQVLVYCCVINLVFL